MIPVDVCSFSDKIELEKEDQFQTATIGKIKESTIIQGGW